MDRNVGLVKKSNQDHRIQGTERTHAPMYELGGGGVHRGLDVVELE